MMREFRRDVHRFFDPLVAFLSSYGGVTFALNAMRGGDVSPFAKGDRVGFLANTAEQTLIFEVGSLMVAIVSEDWVDVLHYELGPLMKEEDLPKKVIHETGRVLNVSAQALFVQYFDSVEDLAIQHQQDSLVRFGKAVRNACAHGGAFRRLDDRAQLSWKGLRLGNADNGKGVFELGLSRGDLISLMSEIDDHLPR